MAIKKKKTPITKSKKTASKSISSKKTKEIINNFHQLLKRRKTTTNEVEIKDIDRAIDELGGMEAYQHASTIGQSTPRGGDSSHYFVKWLAELGVKKSYVADKEKMSLLEIGALLPDNYHSERSWIETELIDLKSNHPSIKEQDFLQRPLPSKPDDEKDAISSSLVLNFVPTPQERGQFLYRLNSVLKMNGWLFMVLPAPCVVNSRYLTRNHFISILETLGFKSVKEKIGDLQKGSRIAYWLLQKTSKPNKPPIELTKKTVLVDGPKLNNFSGDPGDQAIKPGQDRNNFYWLTEEEPHRSRCRAIMKAHPDVKKLFGPDPRTALVVLSVVAIQLVTATSIINFGWHPLSWKFLLTAYVIGGTANQNLFLAIHEITHNLVFKSRTANKALAMAANLPVGIPFAGTFKVYHHEHHRYLGEDGVDTDLPTNFELLFLRNVLGKLFFATFQILFYAIRPGLVNPKPPTPFVLLNAAVQVAFNAIMYKAYGGGIFAYSVMSTFFAGSLHPCAAHFIAEHYMFDGSGQETYSYYGFLNWLCYNVGYHNEHHDFPAVAWLNLPKVRDLAPEFYNHLQYHQSWPLVTFRFIFEREVGLFSRAKRDSHTTKPNVSAARESAILPGEGRSLEGAD
ncbi:hypothetical protein E3Q19_01568 [Wallemia mellicola]|nr:hypothetical protein E3Q19_01568 [Wallemia mellicola]TIC74985.1 hypothetical protein E3Q00_01350 [Wallemia mellicola]